MTNNNISDYLNPTPFIDSDHPMVVEYAHSLARDAADTAEMAINLYQGVRDDIKYSPYYIHLDLEHMKASYTLKRGKGYCVNKAVLFAAVCRAMNIPCRLRFADVKNHLSSPMLREKMGTDLFAYHGYNELLINDSWIKVTPIFNRSLCENLHIEPLEFDGKNDSVLHPYDMNGDKHLEYVQDHGVYDDVPLDKIIAAFSHHYPNLTFHGKIKTKNEFEDEVSPL
jgi:transglutaminase-like putative cysteine protease